MSICDVKYQHNGIFIPKYLIIRFKLHSPSIMVYINIKAISGK